MPTQLPIIIYKRKRYYVDFRLGELRDVKTAKQIKFTSLKEGKYSNFKKRLRALRFRTYNNEYIEGVDD